MASDRHPSDCSDEERAFAAPYLTLMREDAPQRTHPLRETFNGLRHIVRAGNQWRMMPTDLPPWKAVCDQARRWIAAGCFEAMANDLRELLRLAQGRKAKPSAAILDGRTLGHLLALTVTKASEQERAQVAELCRRVQEATGSSSWTAS